MELNGPMRFYEKWIWKVFTWMMVKRGYVNISVTPGPNGMGLASFTFDSEKTDEQA